MLARIACMAEARIWAVLVLLTLGSCWLGIDHDIDTPRAVLAPILVIAMVKAWLVAHYFMELRHAPAWLRNVVAGWLAVTAAVVIGMYLAL